MLIIVNDGCIQFRWARRSAPVLCMLTHWYCSLGNASKVSLRGKSKWKGRDDPQKRLKHHRPRSPPLNFTENVIYGFLCDYLDMRFRSYRAIGHRQLINGRWHSKGHQKSTLLATQYDGVNTIRGSGAGSGEGRGKENQRPCEGIQSILKIQFTED